jgi:hypothetical protein
VVSYEVPPRIAIGLSIPHGWLGLAYVTTADPFDIKVRSLRLGDFTEADLRQLYAQHIAETAQPFTEDALARAW